MFPNDEINKRDSFKNKYKAYLLQSSIREDASNKESTCQNSNETSETQTNFESAISSSAEEVASNVTENLEVEELNDVEVIPCTDMIAKLLTIQ